jgi:putative ABC transport system permease protein
MKYLITNIKHTVRLVRRKKGLNSIGILGIMLGYICFFLSISYVWYEKSYDRFHQNSNTIYRVVYKRYDKETLQYETANSVYPIGRYLKENVPGVINYATLARNYDITVTVENMHGDQVFFNEEKTYFAPSSFLSIFSFPVLKGAIKDLDLPNTVFITERVAKTYYGTDDAIGKVIKVNGKTIYTIAGILKDLPANSHLKFDFLFSMQTHVNSLKKIDLKNHWYGYDLFYTYIQLKEGTDRSVVEKMLPVMADKNYGDKLSAANQKDIFAIQPLTSLHLHSNLEWETEKPGNGDAINILLYFSVFVLIVTWINNINLLIAQAADRAKEVGMRKILGSSERTVIIKLSTETALINIFSMGIAAIILVVVPQFTGAVSSVFSPEVYKDLLFWLVIVVAIAAGILVTSIIPAVAISKYNPVHVLKGKLILTTQKGILTNTLMAFQFIISFVLITGALIVYNQSVFLMKKDRGLDNTAVIAVKFPEILNKADDVREKAAVFKEEIKRLKWVKDYTIATDMPEREITTFGNMYRPALGPADDKAYFRIGADENYFRFFKVKLIAGRFFSMDMATDTSAYILNESAVKKLGYNSADEVIGQKVKSGKKDMTIIGVVNDFHYRSVKVEPVATMFTHQEKKLSYFAVRFYGNDQDIQGHLSEAKKIYTNLFPGNPFEYFFVEDEMKKDLQTDLNFARLFCGFSILSILISLIGLLGLVIINLNQRVRELGIRKVVGASFSNICLLVIKKFVPPLAIALFIGVPLSVWGFSKWIAAYYIYHIPMSWYYFLIPAIFLPAVAIGVIVTQVFRVYNQKTAIALYE